MYTPLGCSFWNTSSCRRAVVYVMDGGIILACLMGDWSAPTAKWPHARALTCQIPTGLSRAVARLWEGGSAPPLGMKNSCVLNAALLDNSRLVL
jgi:hypothetical protein